MATTTNFGWTTPDNTALVKDGALAIRTLGSAIDTSMADLRGGTTGQILAKQTNADMDFQWIANDQGDITAVNVTSPITGGGTTGAVTVGLDMAAASAVTLNDRTATYTAVLTDANQVLVRMNVSTANDFLIPTNANVAFPIGSVINVTQLGTGASTIKAVTPATTTVTSTGATSTAPLLRARYSAASCIKVGTDTWLVVGDLS